MNKKAMVILYYIGLCTGIVIINYILNSNIEYADMLIDSFQNIEKINSVDGRDLCLYLFFKRLKQITLLCFSFFCISDKLTLIFSIIYFSCIQGIIMSLFTFYYGIAYIFPVCIRMLPYHFCVFFLEKIGWNCMHKKRNMEGINYINIFVVIVVVTIVLIILEFFINFKVSLNIFAHK